jgi:hypothetical protein
MKTIVILLSLSLISCGKSYKEKMAEGSPVASTTGKVIVNEVPLDIYVINRKLK